MKQKKGTKAYNFKDQMSVTISEGLIPLQLDL